MIGADPEAFEDGDLRAPRDPNGHNHWAQEMYYYYNGARSNPLVTHPHVLQISRFVQRNIVIFLNFCQISRPISSIFKKTFEIPKNFHQHR